MTLGNWREHPAARAELLAASDRLPVAVAEMLIEGAERAIEDVLASPEAWPMLPYAGLQPQLRRRKIRPFRINVVYYVAADGVRVIAYAHERREPGYWVHRVDDFA